MKPIETHYKGYRFRSRLEARWALFFDKVGLDWTYEPEGFSLPSGPYLPDFFIRFKPDANFTGHEDAGFYIEIKPYMPAKEHVDLARELAIATKHSTIILAGDPVKFEMCKAHRSGNVHCTNGEEYVEDLTTFADGCEFLLAAFCSEVGGDICAVASARTAARSARFEHGECG